MAKKKSTRPARKKDGLAATAAKKSVTEAARQLDQVVREFDCAAEGLQLSVEKLRGTLPELIDIEVRRDRLRRMKALAADSILDSLMRLATALEECGGKGELPESLVPVHRSARMAIDHLCRAFEVQAVYQPGELLTVTEDQRMDFDWSADFSGERHFPVQVEVIRSGWKAGETVLVPPRVGVRHSAAALENGQ
jgi:hypothetical protein